MIREAQNLLQRGLALAQQSPATTNVAPPPQPVVAEVSSRPPERRPAGPLPAAPPPRPPERRPAGPSITLQTAQGKLTFQLPQLYTALLRNDVAQFDAVREGIARLADNRPRERNALETLMAAGIPTPVVAGTPRPAVVDGSNISNMTHGRKASLDYLKQVRKSAWSEGYFPVITIVDASLPHQIDEPDELLAMIERGEVRIAPSGTPADALLIEEAEHLQAVLLTNDRLTDWPAAKKLEKRHVTLNDGVARIGDFHRSSFWFLR
jgi:hypothetical protein